MRVDPAIAGRCVLDIIRIYIRVMLFPVLLKFRVFCYKSHFFPAVAVTCDRSFLDNV